MGFVLYVNGRRVMTGFCPATEPSWSEYVRSQYRTTRELRIEWADGITQYLSAI